MTRKKKKLKSMKKKAPGMPDITPDTAMKNLKKEIISEAKLVATGRSLSIYKLTECAKELIELERLEDSKTQKSG